MDFKRGVVVAIVLVVAASVVAAGYVPQSGGLRGAAAKIGVIRIEGPIEGGSGAVGLTGSTVGADEVLAYLHRAQQDPAIRAVVIRMNSPGGSAAASQEIGAEIQRLSRLGKPVVTSISDVGASGGYWIAATTDRIIANPAAITGSIGVILQLTRYEELYEKLGIEVETIKSGPHKDMGSSARDITPGERELLQAMVDDIYHQFVSVVAEGRNMERDEVLEIADGRILTASQAYDLGLVDAFGTFYDAVTEAAVMADLERYQLYEFSRLSPFARLVQRLGGFYPLSGEQHIPSGFTIMRWLLYQTDTLQPH